MILHVEMQKICVNAFRSCRSLETFRFPLRRLVAVSDNWREINNRLDEKRVAVETRSDGCRIGRLQELEKY